jgi:hypothetical protein
VFAHDPRSGVEEVAPKDFRELEDLYIYYKNDYKWEIALAYFHKEDLAIYNSNPSPNRVISNSGDKV